MQQYPDATDVWVMTDGDIFPFVVKGGTSASEDVRRSDKLWAEKHSGRQVTWSSCRSRFPHVRFHFIAFHHNADRTGMPVMAQQGNGSFSQYTFSG